MNKALRALLLSMLNRNIIGGKHIPESLIVQSKIRQINKNERKEFEKEYKALLNHGFMIRLKKRTGKGYDNHISLNPKALPELEKLIDAEVNK